MRTTRRRFLAAASATATAAAAPALAQSKETEAAGFEEALRAKFAAGDVLDWRGGNVRLRRPIVIEVTSNMLGPGLDLNGAKLIADFNDASKRAITIRIPRARQERRAARHEDPERHDRRRQSRRRTRSAWSASPTTAGSTAGSS